jgi:hypothetical protein
MAKANDSMHQVGMRTVKGKLLSARARLLAVTRFMKKEKVIFDSTFFQ